MFRPTDSGLKFPLKFKNYQGRLFITSADGRELFKMESVVYSLDGRAWLEEWAEWICKKSADDLNGNTTQEMVDDYNKKMGIKEKTIISSTSPLGTTIKKRGRPKKHGK